MKVCHTYKEIFVTFIKGCHTYDTCHINILSLDFSKSYESLPQYKIWDFFDIIPFYVKMYVPCHTQLLFEYNSKRPGPPPNGKKNGKKAHEVFFMQIFLSWSPYCTEYISTSLEMLFFFLEKNDLKKEFLFWADAHCYNPPFFCQKNGLLGNLPGLLEECGWRKSTKYKQVVPREIS